MKDSFISVTIEREITPVLALKCSLFLSSSLAICTLYCIKNNEHFQLLNLRFFTFYFLSYTSMPVINGTKTAETDALKASNCLLISLKAAPHVCLEFSIGEGMEDTAASWLDSPVSATLPPPPKTIISF